MRLIRRVRAGTLASTRRQGAREQDPDAIHFQDDGAVTLEGRQLPGKGVGRSFCVLVAVQEAWARDPAPTNADRRFGMAGKVSHSTRHARRACPSAPVAGVLLQPTNRVEARGRGAHNGAFRARARRADSSRGGGEPCSAHNAGNNSPIRRNSAATAVPSSPALHQRARRRRRQLPHRRPAQRHHPARRRLPRLRLRRAFRRPRACRHPRAPCLPRGM